MSAQPHPDRHIAFEAAKAPRRRSAGWRCLFPCPVRSGLFPLYEVFDGERYRINVAPDWTDPAEYFRRQRRFGTDAVDLEATRRTCRTRFARLKALAEVFPA